MSGRPIDRAELARQLSSFRTAFRWEAQNRYNVPYERDDFARWMTEGAPPQGSWWTDWLADIRRLVRDEHSTVARVRVLDDPPTSYQQWELFLTPQSIAAGEDIRWLSRTAAHDLGLPGYDWWLLDDQRLIITTYNSSDEVATRSLIIDPSELARHRAWRDLAVSRAHLAEHLTAS